MTPEERQREPATVTARRAAVREHLIAMGRHAGQLSLAALEALLRKAEPARPRTAAGTRCRLYREVGGVQLMAEGSREQCTGMFGFPRPGTVTRERAQCPVRW